MARKIDSAAGTGLLLLILFGCAGSVLPPTQTPRSSPTPAAPPNVSPTAQATPVHSTEPDGTPALEGFPATVHGLPVMTVTQAQHLAAAETLDGRLIAVGGYWMQFALPCAFMPHEALLTGFCTGSQFGDTADDVRDYTGGGVFNWLGTDFGARNGKRRLALDHVR